MKKAVVLLASIVFCAVAILVFAIHNAKLSSKPDLTHQQDSLLARIVTLDSLIYELNEKESQKAIVYGKQSNYNRAFFREWDTLHADRRHTTNRLNVINARIKP